MHETIRTPVFTRYELLEELGQGGMGAVYKARQKYVGRMVAFKVLPPALRNDAEALQRFEREASALGRLQHPNVVGVFDAGVEGGFPYLAMEYIEGKNLRQVLQEKGRLSVEAVARLGLEMADALDHIQQQGLVHRDVKPSNIILEPSGKAKLTDFGIAFAATLPRITQGAMGTPEFMSPEQADGKTLDIRSDLYSLGVVLYECLTGAVPFQRDGDSLTSLSQLLNKVLGEAAPRLQDRRPDAPAWLAEAVHRCMEKNPDDRFQTGAALAGVLRANTGQEAAAPPVAPPPTPTLPEPPPAPEPPPVAQETPPPKSETPAPQPAPPRPAAQKMPVQEPAREAPSQESTGSFAYHADPVEIPDAPPSALPVPAKEPKPAKPAKKARKKTKKPRARTAAKVWFFIGLFTFVLFILQFGPFSLGIGTIIFNVLCLTPVLTGALATLFSKSKKKKNDIVKGLLLGCITGLVFSFMITLAIVRLVLNMTIEDFFLLDEVLLRFIYLGSIAATVISGVLTSLFLGIRSLFSSS